ncbi:hypothetical protein TorRG33x02_209500 [Trema orientale]|uniref:Uncharacterized protein n=1 Tax=Trema orientale TaxID=63057 RepID=A0A2P5ECH8_TREOI|nr:hypothetical protein TorRG33x02_209500 [Trema orientale]
MNEPSSTHFGKSARALPESIDSSGSSFFLLDSRFSLALFSWTSFWVLRKIPRITMHYLDFNLGGNIEEKL